MQGLRSKGVRPKFGFTCSSGCNCDSECDTNDTALIREHKWVFQQFVSWGCELYHIVLYESYIMRYLLPRSKHISIWLQYYKIVSYILTKLNGKLYLIAIKIAVCKNITALQERQVDIQESLKLGKNIGEKVGGEEKDDNFFLRLLDHVRNRPIEAPVRRADNMKTNRKPNK